MTGFILGLVSGPLYFIGIIPVLAAVFGIIGLATFKEETQRGKWMAGWGLGLGIVFTLMSINFWHGGGR